MRAAVRTILGACLFVLALAAASQSWAQTQTLTETLTEAATQTGAGSSGPTNEAVLREDGSPDYEAWEKLATRAERVVSDGEASDQAFEELRLQLTSWRAAFNVARGANASRIATLKQQITALGPVPADGATEPEEIATIRADLNAQMQVLMTPVRTAEESFVRSNGLIDEIDTLIRARQQNALLKLGPSPLNPSHISTALSDFRRVFLIVRGELSSSINMAEVRVEFRDNLPAIFVLVVTAIVLLSRGRYWMQLLSARLIRHGASKSWTPVVVMLLSLGQIIVPFMGLWALIGALDLTSFFGSVGTQLIYIFLTMGVFILLARWLGGQTFPRYDAVKGPFDLTHKQRARGRLHLSLLGVWVGSYYLVQQLSNITVLHPETNIVLSFPFVVSIGVSMFTLGRLLQSEVRAHQEDTDDSSLEFRDQLVLALSRATVAFAIIGPILAGIGYERAARLTSVSPALTLQFLAVVSYLQLLVRAVFQAMSPKEAEKSEGLLPTLIGIMIFVAGLPILALIWGARVADLSEAWATFMNGIPVGETVISPRNFLVFAVVFMLGYLATRLTQGMMKNSVLPRTKLDKGGQNAVVSGLGYVGVTIAALIAVTVAGIDLSSLALVAGALSVGIGFGLQNIVSNFVSGIILLIERPISEGDWIEVGPVMGTVRDISVRSTRIETFDRTDVIVPNLDFVNGQVTNWTRSNLTGRLILPVGVAYGSDTRFIEKILMEVAESHPLVVVNPQPQVLFMGFGADSLDFELRVILRDINFMMSVRSELNHRIAEALAKHEVEIPFAQRDIWLRNPEALTGQAPAQTAPSAAPQAADDGGARVSPPEPSDSDPSAPEELT